MFLLTLIGFQLFLRMDSLGLPLQWDTLFVRLVGWNKCRQSQCHILCWCIVDRVKSIVSLMRKILSSCIFCLEPWIVFQCIRHPKIDTHRALCCHCVIMTFQQLIFIWGLLLYLHILLICCWIWSFSSANLTVFDYRTMLFFWLVVALSIIALAQAHWILLLTTSLKLEINYSWTSLTLIRGVSVYCW